jgi:TonB family protein
VAKTRRTSLVVLVLVPVFAIGFRNAGIEQVASALTQHLACDVRWSRDDVDVEQTACLESLASKLRENRKLVGHIISYAGLRAQPHEARDVAYRIRTYLIEKLGLRGRQLVPVDGGFRQVASVELILASPESESPGPTGTLDPDLVEFIDGLPRTKRRIHRSRMELLNSVLFKGDPIYPPLAKAARVEGDVGVKVLIDSQGRVTSARSVYGHPLLREPAEKAALQWTFTPGTSESESITVDGLVVIQFVLESTKRDLIQKT